MDDRRKDYLPMLEVLVACTQALAGKDIPEGKGWIADIQPLSTKLFFHLGTLYHLQEGTLLPGMYGIDFSYIDFPSVAIAARAAFEAYLTAYYIFFHPDNDEVRAFRHKTWKLGGLRDRQKFEVITTPEGRRKMAEEKADIGELREEILRDPLFQQLPDDHKKEALKGNWKLKYKWEDLAELSGHHKGFFITNYAMVCAHAHSSYLSVMQLSQARELEQQRELAKPYTQIGMILVAHFVKNYCSMFQEAQQVIDQNADYEYMVDINYIDAERLEEYYQSLRDAQEE
jgi:hypothetical protein